MAIVADKAGAAALGVGGIDRPYSTYRRSNAGEPNGSVTPAYAGEIVLDTTNNVLWKALNVTNSGWVLLTPGM